jgi:hypothetical protein
LQALTPSKNRAKKVIGKEEVPLIHSFKQLLVMGFVLFHLVIILDCAIPLDFWPARQSRELVAPYMLSIGMTETWDTFAPRPKASEQYLKAIVITTNGNTKIYSFPRMEGMSWIMRYQKERYRKFAESILCPDCSVLWPDIERRVGRQESSATDPPDRVILVSFESPINPSIGLTGNDENAKPVVLSELSLGLEDSQ